MTNISRRQALLFVAAAARMAAAHHQGIKRARTLTFFLADEAAEVEAMAELIIPADETPGAKEAGVIHAIDASLASFDQDKQPLYHEGLADIRRRVGQLQSGATRLSELKPEQQNQLMEAISGSKFFECLRTHTIAGFLCTEERGGNRNHIGWTLIGFEDKSAFQPPFGYYDAEVHSPGRDKV